MEILLDNRQSEIEVEKYYLQLESLALHVLNQEGVDPSAELSVIFVDEEEMKELNSRYRNIYCPTDVLSFSMLEESGEMVNPDRELPVLLGDIVICPQIAARNAQRRRGTLSHELLLLLVHGILHLLGYNHNKMPQKSVMKRREKELLASFLKSGSGLQ